MTKPFSQACENNKQSILSILEHAFRSHKQVLEIGSGTAQHAVHFAQHLKHLIWQTSELPDNHQGINLWLEQAQLPNILPPLNLDLAKPWPISDVDAIFTANTLHIISEQLVCRFFTGVSQHLCEGGTLCVYGPFNYDGQYTSSSNAEFDQWLKQRDLQSGIRDIKYIVDLANTANLTLIKDHSMPANNRLLEFIKRR